MPKSGSEPDSLEHLPFRLSRFAACCCEHRLYDVMLYNSMSWYVMLLYYIDIVLHYIEYCLCYVCCIVSYSSTLYYIDPHLACLPALTRARTHASRRMMCGRTDGRAGGRAGGREVAQDCSECLKRLLKARI